jgi:hypothetical protein
LERENNEGLGLVNRSIEMSKKRNIKNGPFCYQTKAVIRLIREHFDDRPKLLTSALVTYLVLTELASNAATKTETETFSAAHGTIAAYSGLGRQSVISILAEFKAIGIIDVKRRTEGNLKLSNCYTLLSVSIDASDVQVESEQDGHTRRTVLNNKEKNGKNKEEKKIENKKGRKVEYTEEFKQWWEAYPKKVGKQAAYKAFLKVDPDAELLKKMLETIKQWKKSKQWNKDSGQFIPHPQTWLNQGRWDDVLGEDEIDKGDDEESYNDTYTPRGGW